MENVFHFNLLFVICICLINVFVSFAVLVSGSQSEGLTKIPRESEDGLQLFNYIILYYNYVKKCFINIQVQKYHRKYIQ